MAVTMQNITELQMVMDAREWLLAHGGTEEELAANARAIEKYSNERGRGRRDQYTEPGLDDGAPRRSGGGGGHTNGTGGRGPGIYATPAAQQYAARLIHQVWEGFEDAFELVEALPTMTATEVSRLIDTARLIIKDHEGPRMATPGQQRYLTNLVNERMGAMPELFEAIKTMTFAQAKRALDILTATRAADTRAKAGDAFGVKIPEQLETETEAEVTEGMYRDPDGMVIKVQKAHHGSGQLYAKRLVVLDEQRETKGGKLMGAEFVYTPGLINKVQPGWKMTLEEAQEWGRLYGMCCNCGAVLTDEKSIEAGIGPVCAKRF